MSQETVAAQDMIFRWSDDPVTVLARMAKYAAVDFHSANLVVCGKHLLAACADTVELSLPLTGSISGSPNIKGKGCVKIFP
jgi:hypothetical protein